MTDLATRYGLRRSVARRTRAFLERNGYAPEIHDEDSRFPTLSFHQEGTRFLVQLDEKDGDFLQLNLRYRLLEPRPDELGVLRVVHDLQHEHKLVKVWLGPERSFVEFQAPLFLGGRRLGNDLLQRCIALLRHTAAEFSDRIWAAAPHAQA
jgi:hypothetical protein